jgi:hypothetical protein
LESVAIPLSQTFVRPPIWRCRECCLAFTAEVARV